MCRLYIAPVCLCCIQNKVHSGFVTPCDVFCRIKLLMELNTKAHPRSSLAQGIKPPFWYFSWFLQFQKSLMLLSNTCSHWCCSQLMACCLFATKTLTINCSDVIMGAIAFQITSLTTVYTIVYSDADQIKHQSSAPLAFRGIHRWPVNSPHKWPLTRKMFPFGDVIMPCADLLWFPPLRTNFGTISIKIQAFLFKNVAYYFGARSLHSGVRLNSRGSYYLKVKQKCIKTCIRIFTTDISVVSKSSTLCVMC